MTMRQERRPDVIPVFRSGFLANQNGGASHRWPRGSSLAGSGGQIQGGRVRTSPVEGGAGSFGGAGHVGCVPGGPGVGNGPHRSAGHVHHEAAEVAILNVAILNNDGELQLIPQRIAGQDAEIEADIGEDGADRAAANLGGDLCRRRQASKRRDRPRGRWARRLAVAGART